MKYLYGPPNWIAHRFSAEQRRMFAFWTFITACALTPFFGRTVMFVTLLSLLALTSNFSSETPVEEE